MVWLALGLGCLWHGGQIVWAAPVPRQLRKTQTSNETPPRCQSEERTFMYFWLDQYAWIGIVLSFIGLGFIALGLMATDSL
ncbi:MAG: hypothetical protein ACI9UU_000393 [Candidatus Azotimanducaceae bacterium]|jgi:hypothetical protein